jgi:DNA-binding protein H-NS
LKALEKEEILLKQQQMVRNKQTDETNEIKTKGKQYKELMKYRTGSLRKSSRL